MFIDEHREGLGVEAICKVLPIVPSTYYRWISIKADPEKGSKRDLILSDKIMDFWKKSGKRYGAVKIWHDLVADGIKVARLGLVARIKCLAWFTSNRCAKLKALCAASSSSWGFCVPDFSTFSRQGSRLVLPMKPRADRDGPIQLVVDSTGLKIFSEGEWLQNKHKTTAKRKSWRKLHLGLDLATGEIVCSDLTTEDVGDPLHW